MSTRPDKPDAIVTAIVVTATGALAWFCLAVADLAAQVIR